MRSLRFLAAGLLLSPLAPANDLVRYVFSGPTTDVINPASLVGTIWEGVDVGSPVQVELLVRSSNPTPSSACAGASFSSLRYDVLSSVLHLNGNTIVLPVTSSCFSVANDAVSISGGSGRSDFVRVCPARHTAALVGCIDYLDSGSISQPPTALTSSALPLSFSGFTGTAPDSTVSLTQTSYLTWTVGSASVTTPYRYLSRCNGDGGDQAGCTDCPCLNNAPAGTVGGCLNSAATSARLVPSGVPSLAGDTMRFTVEDALPSTFGVLTSGGAIAPTGVANPCFGSNSGVASANLDGLRCAVQSVQRHGVRVTDAVGATPVGWGPPDGPAGGLAAQGGFAAGQTRHYQVVYRELPDQVCMSGLNTTQAISVTFEP